MGWIVPLLGMGVSLFEGNKRRQAASNAARAAKATALTGYNYLNSGAGSAASHQLMQNGLRANNARAQLLGQAPLGQGTNNAFQNYLNSTGYKFKLGQGTNAIESGAASKGLLNSGGTAKALQAYGQGLAGQQFNNYLAQLGGLGATGQKQLGMVTGAAASGGYAAGPVAKATIAAGDAQAAGVGGALGMGMQYFKNRYGVGTPTQVQFSSGR